MEGKNNLKETGRIINIKGKGYFEFIETLPNPNYLRHHYFPQKEKSLKSEAHLTEIKHHPQLLSNLVNNIMISNINNHLMRLKEV